MSRRNPLFRIVDQPGREWEDIPPGADIAGIQPPCPHPEVSDVYTHGGRFKLSLSIARFSTAVLSLFCILSSIPARAQPLQPSETVLDVGEMTTWLRNDALFPWSTRVVNSDGEWWALNGRFPKEVPAGTVFTRGLLWGGQVRDSHDPLVRVGGTTYNSGLTPGRVLRGADGRVTGSDAFSAEKYHVWRVRPDWQTLNFTEAAAHFFGKATVDVTEAEIQAVSDQYAYDWEHWPEEWGAPYEDVDGNGRYDPEIDVPGVPGAGQTLWIVTNDLDSAEMAYGSPAIGIEQQLTLWASDYPDGDPLEGLDAVNFMRARLIYTGRPDTPPGSRIDSMFIALFSDPDVGNPSDDYGGCDTTRALAYAYNGVSHDSEYAAFGLAPPAVGWTILQMPRENDGAPAGLSLCFVKQSGSAIADPDVGRYDGTLQWYNLMRGRQPRPEYPHGLPFVSWLTGEPTRFTVTGDPIRQTGWIDGIEVPPGDRRLWLAAGPFSMVLGDTVDVVVAQIGGLSGNHVASVNHLFYNTDLAQWAFEQETATPTESPAEMPAQLVLRASYPNPFTSSTVVTLAVDRRQHVRLAIYDLLGRRITLLYDGLLEANQDHHFTFDAQGLSSGTYILRATGQTGTAARHIVLSK